MAPSGNTRITEDEGVFNKKFSDRGSYRSELDVLRGLKSDIAPKLLGHDDHVCGRAIHFIAVAQSHAACVRIAFS